MKFFGELEQRKGEGASKGVTKRRWVGGRTGKTQREDSEEVDVDSAFAPLQCNRRARVTCYDSAVSSGHRRDAVHKYQV